MRSKSLLIAVFISNLLYGGQSEFIDFGIKGQLYEIVEENGNDLIARALKEVDTNRIVNELKDETEASFVSKISLPDSTKTNESSKMDYVPARWDVVEINGNVIAKKGDLIPSFLPNGVKLELCFINGNESNKVNEYIINDFGRDCIYMVNNVDSRKFAEKYSLKEVYPISEQSTDYLERFSIKSFPTKITKHTKFIDTKTIDIVSLRKKLLGVR